MQSQKFGPLALVLILSLAACAGRRADRDEPPPLTLAEGREADARGRGGAPMTGAPTPEFYPFPSPAQGSWAAIASSRQQRPILASTMAGARVATSSPRLYIIASIHGNEAEGLAVIDRLADDLRASPTTATIRIVRDMNPDGTAARSRTNAAGVDLNRNWPARSFTPSSDRGPSPLSEPESAAVLADIERFAPTLVIVLHSTAAGPFVNYDGPAADAATRFATAAVAHDSRWRVVPDMGYPTPGSIGSLIGDDRQIPILTIEFRRGQPQDSVWPALRDGVRAVAEPR